MSFDPKKFFIGVVDFFSVLLPGALLTFALMDAVGPRFPGAGYQHFERSERWLVFLFSAYVLGHLVFLVGARWLDDLYDWVRKGTDHQQVEALADGRELASPLARWLATRFLQLDARIDHAVRRATRIKRHHLDPLGASSAVNAFQWSKVRLTLEKPEALATVLRFEADSKFFRSFAVVLCVLVVWVPIVHRREPVTAVGAAALLVAALLLAVWRYADQRTKAIAQAYWFVIQLEARRAKGFREPSRGKGEGAERAGGVVMRRVHDRTECLLVRPRSSAERARSSGEWVLPKGRIEAGESAREAALREVHEEAGQWARVAGELEPLSFRVDGEQVQARMFLMEPVAPAHQPLEKGREPRWCSLDDALPLVHDETRALLESARAMDAARLAAAPPVAATG